MTANSPNTPAASDALLRWLTDPDWPDKLRVWPGRIPPDMIQTLASLSHQVAMPLELVAVNLTTDALSVRPLSGWPSSGRSSS